MNSLRPLARTTTCRLRTQAQCRYLSIHEYQSQSLLRDAGVPVPRGNLATTPSEALSHAKSLGSFPVVLKSQILAGGRGKGHFLNSSVSGGIQMAKSAEQAEELASGMLGHHLVTKQTKSEGIAVEKLYVTEKIPYTNEYYLSITIDRENAAPTLIVSRHGGMNIEEAAKTDPESVAKLRFDYLAQSVDENTLKAAQKALALPDAELEGLRGLLDKLITLFKTKDATLIEINPLVRTTSNELLCLDAKFSFDNAAAPRQKELFSWEEKGVREKAEVEAEKSGLVYVRLEGDIGNVVNGAGLAMATNDAVEYYGGRSANFLDAGGQATKETMVDAFRIILDDERVKVILVNIYGGITRCDMIAESIIAAAAELGPLRVPIVVRLQGTNAEKGQELIANCDLDIHAAAGFGEAAKKATEMAKEAREREGTGGELAKRELTMGGVGS